MSSVRIPKYRKHRPSGNTSGLLFAHAHDLGLYGTNASKLAYLTP